MHLLDTDLSDAELFRRHLRSRLLHARGVRHRRCINSGTYCFCSTVSDPKFAGQTSEIGGVDINFGRSPGTMIHVAKHSSIQHPTIQMLLFASCLDQGFTCPRSMVPKSIVDVPMTRRSSALSNVYEAGSVNPSLPVLVNISMKKETRSTVSSTSPALDDIWLDSGASHHLITEPIYLKQSLAHTYTDFGSTPNIDKAQTSTDSVDFVIDSGSSFLAPAASLDEQVTLNDLGDQRNNEPCPNGPAAISSSAKTTCVPLVHKRTDNGSQHHSDPDSGVTERGNVEETEKSDAWVFATGAAHHATGNRDLIADFEAECGVEFVYAADGTQMQVLGCGNVVTRTVVLPGVLYVAGLMANLVSVAQLAELDYTIAFGRAACLVSSPADGTVVGRAHARDDGLYVVDNLTIPIPRSPRRRIDQHAST